MLSGPHQKFAEGIASGLNGTEAYQAAYPKVKRTTAGANSHELLKNAEIITEIERLREVVEGEFKMSRVEWLEGFMRIAKKAEQTGDLQAAKGCFREIGLAMPGWYAPDKVKIEGDAVIRVTIGQ